MPRPAFAQPASCREAVRLRARSIALNIWLGENGLAIKPSGRAACARLGAIQRSVQLDIDKRQSRTGLGGESQSLRPGSRDTDDAKPGNPEHRVNKARDQRLVLDDKNARRLACVQMRNHLNPVAC